jgi:hypothetical protein
LRAVARCVASRITTAGDSKHYCGENHTTESQHGIS